MLSLHNFGEERQAVAIPEGEIGIEAIDADTQGMLGLLRCTSPPIVDEQLFSVRNNSSGNNPLASGEFERVAATDKDAFNALISEGEDNMSPQRLCLHPVLDGKVPRQVWGQSIQPGHTEVEGFSATGNDVGQDSETAARYAVDVIVPRSVHPAQEGVRVPRLLIGPGDKGTIVQGPLFLFKGFEGPIFANHPAPAMLLAVLDDFLVSRITYVNFHGL